MTITIVWHKSCKSVTTFVVQLVFMIGFRFRFWFRASVWDLSLLLAWWCNFIDWSQDSDNHWSHKTNLSLVWSNDLDLQMLCVSRVFEFWRKKQCTVCSYTSFTSPAWCRVRKGRRWLLYICFALHLRWEVEARRGNLWTNKYQYSEYDILDEVHQKKKQ